MRPQPTPTTTNSNPVVTTTPSSQAASATPGAQQNPSAPSARVSGGTQAPRQNQTLAQRDHRMDIGFVLDSDASAGSNAAAASASTSGSQRVQFAPPEVGPPAPSGASPSYAQLTWIVQQIQPGSAPSRAATNRAVAAALSSTPSAGGAGARSTPTAHVVPQPSNPVVWLPVQSLSECADPGPSKPTVYPGEKQTLTLSQRYIDSLRQKVPRERLARSFGPQDNYRQVLQDIVDALNGMTDRRTRMQPKINDHWLTTLPDRGKVLFSLDGNGQVDDIRIPQDQSDQGITDELHRMSSNTSQKKLSPRYANALRERYLSDSTRPRLRSGVYSRRTGTGLGLSPHQLRMTQLTASSRLQNMTQGHLVDLLATRFGVGVAPSEVVANALGAVNALLQAASARGGLDVNRVQGSHEIYLIDVPYSVQQPNFAGERFTLAVQLNSAGQVEDIDRADTDARAAVERIRARIAKRAKDQLSQDPGPSGSSAG